jgi:hypothetical protein
VNNFKKRIAIAAVLTSGVLGAGSLQAASVSYDLTLSNDGTGNIPDGASYASVTIDDTGGTGLINFTVTILDSILTDNAGDNFGLQDFGFNVLTPGDATGLVTADITNLPTDWIADVSFTPPNSGGTAMDGFGKFDVAVDNTGTTRLDPLTFSIDLGLDQTATDDIFDYIAASVLGSGDGPFFAAHIVGFNDLNPLPPADDPEDGMGDCYDTTGMGDYTAACNFLTSVWVAGDTPVPPAEVPVPAAVWLFGSGLLGLVGIARRKKPA